MALDPRQATSNARGHARTVSAWAVPSPAQLARAPRASAAGWLLVVILAAACNATTPATDSQQTAAQGESPAATVGAASSADQSAFQGSDGSPCNLLTSAQVASALGVPPTTVGAGDDSLDPQQCTWTYTDPNDSFGGYTASVSTGGDISGFTPGTVLDVTTVAVSGVGDEAYFVSGEGLGLPGSYLVFQVGQELFTTGLLTGNATIPTETQRTIETTLARDILTGS